MRMLTGAVGVLLVSSHLLLLLAQGRTEVGTGTETVIASVNGHKITSGELDTKIGSRTAPIRAEEYRLKRAVLEGLILELLLDQSAASRGLTRSELLRDEVLNKVVEPTDLEVSAVFSATQDRYVGSSEIGAKENIRLSLKRQRSADLQKAFMDRLRAQSSVVVDLPAPRVNFDISGSPTKGPDSAPVTIVEIVDFECSFCAMAAKTISKLTEKYGERLRLVAVNLPLPSHRSAMKAAQAALCAGAQGEYWKAHNLLFERQKQLGMGLIDMLPSLLGIQEAEFNACMIAERYASKIRSDSNKVADLGISATPAFLVNGQLVSGAAPETVFVQIIEDELRLTQFSPSEHKSQ